MGRSGRKRRDLINKLVAISGELMASGLAEVHMDREGGTATFTIKIPDIVSVEPEIDGVLYAKKAKKNKKAKGGNGDATSEPESELDPPAS